MDNGPFDPTDSRQTHRIEMLLLATLVLMRLFSTYLPGPVL
jgi:hypothetical protein